MPAKLAFDIAKPNIELLRGAAIHRWKRSDHAVAAGSSHKLDARYQEHRRGDQRQADAITKAAKEVGGSQTRAFHWFIVPRCKFLVLASDNIGAGEDRQQKTAGGKHVRPAPRLSNRLRTNLAGAGALPLPDCLQLAGRIDHLSRRGRADWPHAKRIHATGIGARRARGLSYRQPCRYVLRGRGCAVVAAHDHLVASTGVA